MEEMGREGGEGEGRLEAPFMDLRYAPESSAP